ncbi:hypothetical protein DFP72DRAFT_903296 [Ephemerocybe angulata]|uniref:RING-type E3 ubiquitin transferase n=1 Tax=Ephemerocybe angulata TaxID=980116 RepID=A0A8H6HTT1_9AGAR|nr:hypothetical protein DFP72DRAFT_903296 [Tulosesus angulatus]
MQEAEEQDTCRICSAPAEPDQPLFHPCKCSGTIRYIHQDCLTTWLAHSRKKTCDVCKHPYSFTKVYAPNMPSHLPPFLLARRFIQHGIFGLLFLIRVIGVAIIWLAVLPWITVWTWRMYFSMGETTAWWISNRPRENHNETLSLFPKVPRYEGGYPDTKTIMANITTHPAWISLSKDIFTGQIIAALIVLTFVAIFLLREWISQNARPGLFEEEDFIPEEQPPPAAPEPPPPRVPRFQGFPDADAFARQQREAERALAALRANGQPPGTRREAPPFPNEERIKRQNRGLPPLEEQRFLERMQRPEYNRRVKHARVLAAQRRAMAIKKAPTSPLAAADRTFDFRFDRANGANGNGTPEWLSPTASTFGGSDAATSPPAREPFFPPVRLQPPKEDIPYAIRSTPPATPAADQNAEAGPSTSTSFRRPMLPASTLAMANSDNRFTISPGRSPMTSPGLATYHPPEEFNAVEAGSSSANNASTSASYFDAVQELERQDDLRRGRSEEDEIDFAELTRRNSAMRQAQRDRDARDALALMASLQAAETTNSEEETEEEEEEESTDQVEFENPEPAQLDEEEPVFFGRGDQFGDEDDEDDDAEMFFMDEEEAAQMRQAPPPVPLAEGPDMQPPNDNMPNGVQGDMDDGDFDGDDLDGNVEDDMEGALEAVGIQGPIFGVFQNAALMVFVLDTAIGLCIWIPYTIGKTTALLALDPKRFLQILHLPIKAMRLVTDPIVDSAAYVITRFFLPPWIKLLRNTVSGAGSLVSTLVATLLGKKAANHVTGYSHKLYEQSMVLIDNRLSRLPFWSGSQHQFVEVASPDPEYLFPEHLRFLEPAFAHLGKEVRVFSSLFKAAWTERAVGNSPSDRLFAVALGYLVFACLLALYLNILTVGNARTAGRAIRNAIRQQLLVVKVALFIFIELVLFPLGCGIVLDICTVWLFPAANVQTRLYFFSQAPLTALFYHWIAGTLFMYSFAVLLSGCRSIMRPGAMWFVKDPEDRNAHPIRDILERNTFTQLRKIFVSGLMYSFVVLCLVGSIAGLMVLGNKSILPFRWKHREPLSNVPIDLLFLHLVLPQSMHHFRPKRFVRQFSTRLWKTLAARFRLTSYFFGGRHIKEEITPSQSTFGHDSKVPKAGVFEGTFRRVPATDQLALPRDARATAQVYENGVPFDEEAAKLIERQNQEAEKAGHDPSKDYMIVYVPPHFRYRLFAFMFSMWSICAVLVGLAVALPIQLGRSVFLIFTSREVHDGYSLMVGFYLLWACYLVGKSVDRLDKRRQRVRVDDGPHADLRLLVVKRGLLWIAKSLYMGISLGVVVPILLALVVDLYVVLPLRAILLPRGMVPTVRLLDAWAIGLVYGKIALHVTQLHPPNHVTRGLHHVVANGWVRVEPIKATKEVIAPLVGGLLAMTLAPSICLQLVKYFLPTIASRAIRFLLQNLHPIIFIVAASIRVCVLTYKLLALWSQSIRDKEFLVELRLRNHDPESEKFLQNGAEGRRRGERPPPMLMRG